MYISSALQTYPQSSRSGALNGSALILKIAISLEQHYQQYWKLHAFMANFTEAVSQLWCFFAAMYQSLFDHDFLLFHSFHLSFLKSRILSPRAIDSRRQPGNP